MLCAWDFLHREIIVHKRKFSYQGQKDHQQATF